MDLLKRPTLRLGHDAPDKDKLQQHHDSEKDKVGKLLCVHGLSGKIFARKLIRVSRRDRDAVQHEARRRVGVIQRDLVGWLSLCHQVDRRNRQEQQGKK